MRPFNVYGPRQVGDGAIRGMIIQALQHAPITLYNDGTQIRAWCYVDDFVDGVLRVRREAGGDRAGRSTWAIRRARSRTSSWRNMIIRLTNSKSTIVFKPHPGPEVDLRVPSIEKAMTLLDFNPRTSLDAGISRADRVVREHLAGFVTAKPSMRLIVTGASGIHRPQRAAARAARLARDRAVPRDAGTRAISSTAQGCAT